MSTPLFQEALIEAKKLRAAATEEAKNAVLEAVSPMIKRMIDQEISGVILEQEEPAADLPPPAPPPPSPDAGATGPVDVTAPPGAEAAPPMPGMAPAVAKAAPPIVAPEGTSVPGKFETDPTTGAPTIVLNINDLFTKTAPEAAAGTEELPPAEMPAPESLPPSDAEPPPPGTNPEEPPPPPALAEIYRAVNRLLAEQKRKKSSLKEDAAAAPIAPAPTAAGPGAGPPPVPPPTGAPPTPPTPGMTPEQMMAAPPAPGAIDPATGQPMAPPAPPAAPPAPPAAPPPPPPGAIDPATGQPMAPPGAIDPATGQPMAPPAPGASPPPAAPPPPPPAPPPVTEYKVFKAGLERVEEAVNSLAKRTANRSSLVKEVHQRDVLSLYGKLVGLKDKNAISARVFALNEERLDLLHENLNLIYSYTQNPLTKGKTMRTKNSLRDFARSLFEGAEGFDKDKEVGHVDPSGNSDGIDADHAHNVSGNPKKHDAKAAAAPFATKEKNDYPGKPDGTSLLEQLEEEIAEMMGEMTADEGADEAVLEMADEDVMAEARKARSRLRRIREQAEEEAAAEDDEDGGDDHLSLTIDLDGVSGDDVGNVNISLDGDDLDVDMDDMGDDGEEAPADMDGMDDMGDDGEEAPADMEDMEDGEEAPADMEDEEEVMKEARRLIRRGTQASSENNALRGQLQETRLLTARSLYLNKIFVRDDLSGAQKRKIVEYLDSARTIAEAKEVYNRVVRVLNTATKSGIMKESADRRYVLSEANRQVEPSFDTSRWQILAGVKKTAK